MKIKLRTVEEKNKKEKIIIYLNTATPLRLEGYVVKSTFKKKLFITGDGLPYNSLLDLLKDLLTFSNLRFNAFSSAIAFFTEQCIENYPRGDEKNG